VPGASHELTYTYKDGFECGWPEDSCLKDTDLEVEVVEATRDAPLDPSLTVLMEGWGTECRPGDCEHGGDCAEYCDGVASIRQRLRLTAAATSAPFIVDVFTTNPPCDADVCADDAPSPDTLTAAGSALVFPGTVANRIHLTLDSEPLSVGCDTCAQLRFRSAATLELVAESEVRCVESLPATLGELTVPNCDDVGHVSFVSAPSAVDEPPCLQTEPAQPVTPRARGVTTNARYGIHIRAYEGCSIGSTPAPISNAALLVLLAAFAIRVRP